MDVELRQQLEDLGFTANKSVPGLAAIDSNWSCNFTPSCFLLYTIIRELKVTLMVLVFMPPISYKGQFFEN